MGRNRGPPVGCRRELWESLTCQILQGDCHEVLKTLDDRSIHCCINEFHRILVYEIMGVRGRSALSRPRMNTLTGWGRFSERSAGLRQ